MLGSAEQGISSFAQLWLWQLILLAAGVFGFRGGFFHTILEFLHMPQDINLLVSRQICFIFNHVNLLLKANQWLFNWLEILRSHFWMCARCVSHTLKSVGPEDQQEDEDERGGEMLGFAVHVTAQKLFKPGPVVAHIRWGQLQWEKAGPGKQEVTFFWHQTLQKHEPWVYF